MEAVVPLDRQSLGWYPKSTLVKLELELLAPLLKSFLSWPHVLQGSHDSIVPWSWLISLSLVLVFVHYSGHHRYALSPDLGGFLHKSSSHNDLRDFFI